MARVVRGIAAEPNKWKRRAHAGSSRASGRTRISPARGDGDRSGVRGRPLADDAKSGRSAAANGSARPVRRLASSTGRRWRAAFSQLLALGSSLDRALSNQREDRTEWGGRNLAAGACPSWRCSRRQFAARKLHSAVRRAAGRAAQRGNRGDAGSGDAARAGGGAVDPASLMAARSSGSRASSLCRRSPPPDARPPARPQLRLLQQARLAATSWARISMRRSFVAIGVRRGRRSARGGRLPLWADCASWRT